MTYFLIFSKTDNCWGYDMAIGPPTVSHFTNSASVVLAAARELTAVSKYCWSILDSAAMSASSPEPAEAKNA